MPSHSRLNEKHSDTVDSPVNPLPTQSTIDTLGQVRRSAFGQYISSDPKYQHDLSSYLLLFSLGIQDASEPYIAKDFLSRTKMDWIACFTNTSTRFTDLMASLECDAQKEAYYNQLDFICRNLLQLCGSPFMQHLPKQDLTISEGAEMLAALLEVPYSQPFEVYETSEMSDALSNSELYREGGCPTNDEVQSMAHKLWKQVIFSGMDCAMIPRDVLFNSGINSLEEMLINISYINERILSHSKPPPLVWFFAWQPRLHATMASALKQWAESKEAISFFEKLRKILRSPISLRECGLYLAALLGRQRLLFGQTNCLEPTSDSVLVDFHTLLWEDTPRERLGVIEKLSQALLRNLQSNIIEAGPDALENGKHPPMSMLWSFFKSTAWTIDPMDWVLQLYWDIRGKKCIPDSIAYEEAWTQWRFFVQRITYYRNLETHVWTQASKVTDTELSDTMKK